MFTPSLGIDIAKKSFDVALVKERGVCATGHFNNCPAGFGQLASWLAHHDVPCVHACMEATGRYGDALAVALHEQGHRVSIVNPLRIRAYGQSKLLRTKTDKADAQLIADFCATQSPSLWQPRSIFQSQLQSLSRRLDALKQSHSQEINRLGAQDPSPAVRRSIEEHIDFLDRQIQQLEEAVRQLLDQDNQMRTQIELLCSIPGISHHTAAKFLAEVPDISRFPQAKHIVAYAGLCPRQHTSGTSVRKKTRLAKSGSSSLRSLFYMPALSAMRYNPLILPLVQRLRTQGKHPRLILGAVMRKLLHLAYGVLKTGQPFDPLYLSAQAPP